MTVAKTRDVRDGFTLVEILIAIAIVAIAAVMVGPNLYKYVAGAKETTTKSNLRTLKMAIDQFYLDIGEHPDRLPDLVRKPKEERLAKKWTASYLESSEVPTDGWGRSYQYKKPGEEGHPYELYSFGPDGKGAPKAEWISVWKL